MVDSVEECCHSNESAVCCTSVACVDDLLCSLEQLSRGVGIDETSSAVVLQKYKDKKEGTKNKHSLLSWSFCLFTVKS